MFTHAYFIGRSKFKVESGVNKQLISQISQFKFNLIPQFFIWLIL